MFDFIKLDRMFACGNDSDVQNPCADPLMSYFLFSQVSFFNHREEIEVGNDLIIE